MPQDTGNADVPTKDMSIRRPYFEHIANGAKTVEVRVAYSSMRKIQPGSRIRFVSGDEECMTVVGRVETYSSFEELLEQEDPAAIAPDITTTQELLKQIREIYPPEKEALGVLAIHVERLPQPSG